MKSRPSSTARHRYVIQVVLPAALILPSTSVMAPRATHFRAIQSTSAEVSAAISRAERKVSLLSAASGGVAAESIASSRAVVPLGRGVRPGEQPHLAAERHQRPGDA